MLYIKEALWEDLEAIHALECAVFSDPWSVKSLRETWQQNQAWILEVCQEEEETLTARVVGYVIFYHVLDEGEIARIAVDASFRRQGAASQLLKALEDKCDAQGVTRMMLDVRKSNEGAIAFYHRQGFTEDGIRRNFYRDPVEDAVLMSRTSGREMEGLTAVSTRNETDLQI